MDPASGGALELPGSPGEAASEASDLLFATVHGIFVDFVAHLPLLATGLVVLLATWGAVALFRHFSGLLLGRFRLRGSLQELVVRLGVIAVWSLGLVLAGMVVFPGLTPARALGGLGLVSIAVGFAFKDIFENFFAGILILWRFPFERGDFIECQGILGRVEHVSVRMTEIRRPSGELVVLPNGFLFRNPVEVLTFEQKRRVAIVASIAYGEEVATAIPVIEKAVSSCDTVSTTPPVEVFPLAFGASSVDIEVAWWTQPAPLDVRRSRGEVVAAVKHALDEAAIEIPFPYRTLTFKEPLRLASADDAADDAA